MSKTLKSRFSRLFNYIKTEIDPNPSIWIKTKVTLDFLWEKLILKNELIDYIQYRFYYKTRPERNNFITHSKLIEIMNICNDPKSRKIFDNKPIFNKEFKEYLGRDFLDSREAEYEDIITFFNNHEKVIAKTPDGMFGKGMEIFEKSNEILDQKFVEYIKKNNFLLEEFLDQHIELEEFNKTSVNTIRIVTLRTADDQVKVMCGVLRLGRLGKFADNFHHSGIASLIDVDTGIVYTDGVDGEWNRYVIHPDSKKAICGFNIPKWDEIKKLVEKTARKFPEVRYVGWDVTIKKDGTIVLIEGNPGADPDITQIPDQRGKWLLYKSELEKIKKL